MKKITFLLVALSTIAIFAFTTPKKAEGQPHIKWLSIQEAEKLSQKNPKKIFVDVYTSWCGWCKEMDRTTFADPKVVEYVTKNFYAVKFDAEGKDSVVFNKQTFINPGAGGRTTHQLAMAIGSQNGRMGYPTISYLDESKKVISVVPGYLPADQFLMYLKYINEGAYKTQSIDEFMNNPSNQ